MDLTGLVSVSFRKLSDVEIVKLTKSAGLRYIEWGGDIHVPPTNIENAKAVAKMTRLHGLEVSSYGSYYRCGENADFLPYLETAKALGAPRIRIWAGDTASKETNTVARKNIVNDAKCIAKQAQAYGIVLNFEYHPNTLTDDCISARKLCEEINEPNCRLYWQPNFNLSHEENIKSLVYLADLIDIVHVFYWKPDFTRLPLREGASVWEEYLSQIRSKKDILYLLEFVCNDNPCLLDEEATTLKKWMQRNEKL